MSGLFRITRAEFAKVFKKPTVYIMAFILALALVGSMFIYKPQKQSNPNVAYVGDNASDYYSAFYGNNDITETKTDMDNAYYLKAEANIEITNSIFSRDNIMNTELAKLKNNLEKLTSAYAVSKTNPNLEKLINETNKNFLTILDTYADFSSLTKYDALNKIINSKKLTTSNQSFVEREFYQVKTFDTNDTDFYTYNQLVISINTLSTDPETYIEQVKTNNYLGVMTNLVNYGSNIIENILIDFTDNLNELQKEYVYTILNTTQSTEIKKYTKSLIDKYEVKIKEFKTLVDGLTTSSISIALHTSKDYTDFTDAYAELIKNFDLLVDSKDKTEYTYPSQETLCHVFNNNNYTQSFKNYINKLNILTPNANFIEKMNNIKKQVEENQTKILKNIDELKEEASTGKIAKEITNYKLLGKTYLDITNFEMLSLYSESMTLAEMKNCKNIDLTQFNIYENNQKISEANYKLKNNIYENDFGTVYSLNQTSGYKENAYDFVYFALKIATLLITIFTIMMIANVITSETESGTIKLLLMRPYKRGTILLGKILSTFFFSLCFLLLSVIISLVAGILMYGAPAYSQILVTFNASKTIMINPILLLFLNVLSCAGDILFYLIIALTVAVLFRSYIGAISTSLIIYVGAVVLGAYIPNSVVFAYLPFTNISWFRYFGGEAVASKAKGLTSLLASPVHSYQTIWASLIISTVFAVALLITTFLTFKRRDF